MTVGGVTVGRVTVGGVTVGGVTVGGVTVGGVTVGGVTVGGVAVGGVTVGGVTVGGVTVGGVTVGGVTVGGVTVGGAVFDIHILHSSVLFTSLDLDDWSKARPCSVTKVDPTQGLVVHKGTTAEVNQELIALFRYHDCVFAINEKCPHAGKCIKNYTIN